VDDLSLGGKWNLYNDGKLALGVTASAIIPSGGGGFRSPRVLPAGVFSLDYELDETNSVGVNVGAGVGLEGSTSFVQGLAALDYVHDFGDVTV
jgi:hypothetical protein